MNFIANTKEELSELNIQDGRLYSIEYLDRDYFNGDENIQKVNAKAIVDDELVSFIITDDYGMEKFINEVKILV